MKSISTELLRYKIASEHSFPVNKDLYSAEDRAYAHVIEMIEDCPEVEPEREETYWVRKQFETIIGADFDEHGNVKEMNHCIGVYCIKCGGGVLSVDQRSGKTSYKFCPHCGRKAVGYV